MYCAKLLSSKYFVGKYAPFILFEFYPPFSIALVTQRLVKSPTEYVADPESPARMVALAYRGASQWLFALIGFSYSQGCRPGDVQFSRTTVTLLPQSYVLQSCNGLGRSKGLKFNKNNHAA